MSARNRRLVPMPAERRASAPVAAIAPSGLKAWHCFAFLIVTAITYYYVGALVLLIAAVDGLVRGWWYLTNRFPRTMTAVNLFIAALCNSGRRRRW